MFEVGQVVYRRPGVERTISWDEVLSKGKKTLTIRRVTTYGFFAEGYETHWIQDNFIPCSPTPFNREDYL